MRFKRATVKPHLTDTPYSGHLHLHTSESSIGSQMDVHYVRVQVTPPIYCRHLYIPYYVQFLWSLTIQHNTNHAIIGQRHTIALHMHTNYYYIIDNTVQTMITSSSTIDGTSCMKCCMSLLMRQEFILFCDISKPLK